ncbi:MAG: cobyric acid synthase [Verrucomicrobiota bacterium]
MNKTTSKKSSAPPRLCIEKKKALCLLGTGSDVGKSVVVAALCRIFKNRGINVAPYKAQNMSNNSYVTLEGGEMGRAQVVQAEACGIEPHTDMNPVLLKPNTDIGSQVVVQGHATGNTQAADYFKNTSHLFDKSKESMARLKEKHDLIVIEGAGSCAEVNLRPRDFVNFETAHAAEAPVILIADIDRGGVFAQLVGSLEVIPERDRKRVAGFIINKFRGDAALFDEGIKYLEEKTGLPVLGLIPYYRHIEIDPEDGMPLETVIDPPTRPLPGKINIAAIRLPHISNFTDFNPLIRNPAVSFHYLSKPRPLDGYDALIIPGTKNVRFDLQWLRDTGWENPIQEFAASGGRVLGVCGGYQMLGKQVHDPHGVEGEPGSTPGFDLLDIETTLEKDKVLSRSQGTLDDETFIDGYEIHMGQTALGEHAKPLVQLTARNGTKIDETDGATSEDGKVWGTYFHGLFDFPGFRNRYLTELSASYTPEDIQAAAEFKQTQYDLLAEHFEQHLDMKKLLNILNKQQTK